MIYSLFVVSYNLFFSMDYKFPSTKNNETLCNSDLNIEAGVEQKKYNGKLYVG